MKRVCIILVNWNGWADTLECLESLLRLSYPNFSIVVCDNGSSDDSLQQISDWAIRHNVSHVEVSAQETADTAASATLPLLTLVRIGENRGFAGANNIGLRLGLQRSDVDYFWLLNNDTVVEPEALNSLVTRMEQDQQIGLCGSTLLLYHDRQRIQALGGGHYCRWIGLPWHYRRFFSRWRGSVDRDRAEARMNYVEGASMLVSRHFIEAIGLMCEDYFLFFEEADWALRAAGRFRLGYAPDSVVYHKVGSSIGTSSHPARKSFTCDYYNIRNRILFTRRFYPQALPLIYLMLLGETLLRICYGRWERASMILGLMLRGGTAPDGTP